uniref:Integron gene cassette protein n=1 Tax=Macrostomum lignano TaxID=282301 RepID=A0A1I8FDB0_9PLAT
VRSYTKSHSNLKLHSDFRGLPLKRGLRGVGQSLPCQSGRSRLQAQGGAGRASRPVPVLAPAWRTRQPFLDPGGRGGFFAAADRRLRRPIAAKKAAPGVHRHSAADAARIISRRRSGPARRCRQPLPSSCVW